ncbi:hypothetical protein BDD12DRAFT_802096 [Trichophaea hybrida]|nr:hypothetical protein BDD12DRAFT_802096 [Trichophaea hybrida]
MKPNIAPASQRQVTSKEKELENRIKKIHKSTVLHKKAVLEKLMKAAQNSGSDGNNRDTLLDLVQDLMADEKIDTVICPIYFVHPEEWYVLRGFIACQLFGLKMDNSLAALWSLKIMESDQLPVPDDLDFMIMECRLQKGLSWSQFHMMPNPKSSPTKLNKETDGPFEEKVFLSFYNKLDNKSDEDDMEVNEFDDDVHIEELE